MEASLSFSAEQLLGALERRVIGEAPPERWLVELVVQDRALVEAEAGGELDALLTRARGETEGPALTRAEIAERATAKAADDEREVAGAADVAAVVVAAAAATATLVAPAAPDEDEEPEAEPDERDATAEPVAPIAKARPPAETEPATEPAPTESTDSSDTASEEPDLIGAGRTFRLFVSSTFDDLREERDALHREVFPKLRALCALHSARFQVIDLRWGVSIEAGLDQKTMPLCVGEIERCQRTDRPNFLVLLGDRYGWRPLPATIPADEFDRIVEAVAPQETLPEPEFVAAPDDFPKQKSSHFSESYASWKRTPEQLLREWYVLDENAVPRAYVLRPREKHGDYGVTADGEVYEDWKRVEHYLGLILRETVVTLGFSDSQLVRYLSSATEQEIAKGALEVPDAAEDVYCFFRTIGNLPHDESSKKFEDITDGKPDSDARARLQGLKKRLRSRVPDNVCTYDDVRWDPDECAPTTDHLGELCDDVKERLSAAIDRRFREHVGKTALEVEQEAHESFGRERAKVFIGRDEPLAAIAAHLTNRPGRLLVVHGVSGSGKSALMAKAAQKASGGTGPLVARFVGATASSSEGRSLLADLCRQIGHRYEDDSEVPADYRELVEEFPKRLGLATADRPLTLFVDALDQLGAADPARSLTWLPAQLPEHVAIVVSTLPVGTLDALRSKRPEAEFVEVQPMTEDEAEDVLDAWLRGADRTLTSEQRAEVLRGFQQQRSDEDGDADADRRLPLYLKLAFEEARLWRSDESHEPLKGDIPGLIRDNLFNRLDDPENHGETLVHRALSYLAASRYGLAEDELLDVLSRDDAILEWLREQSAETHQALPEVAGEARLPVVLWSRLYADLEPYLAERATEGATALAFYHRQFGEVARDTYLSGDDKTRRHDALAVYFWEQIDPGKKKTWVGQDVRSLSELPYHLTEAEDWEGVEDVLTDFRFLERKVAEVGIVEQTDADGEPTKLYTGVFQLSDDFDHALAQMSGEGDDQRRRIIVTAVDLGNGLEIRCPHCNRMIPWRDEYKGDEKFTCPLTDPDCKGPLKVNDFVVERSTT